MSFWLEKHRSYITFQLFVAIQAIVIFPIWAIKHEGIFKYVLIGTSQVIAYLFISETIKKIITYIKDKNRETLNLKNRIKDLEQHAINNGWSLTISRKEFEDLICENCLLPKESNGFCGNCDHQS